MPGMILKKLLNKIKSTITNSSENKAQCIFSNFVKNIIFVVQNKDYSCKIIYSTGLIFIKKKSPGEEWGWKELINGGRFWLKKKIQTFISLEPQRRWREEMTGNWNEA